MTQFLNKENFFSSQLPTLSRKKIILAPISAAFILFGSNGLILRFGLYHIFWWLDLLMHFLGGGIAAVFFAILFKESIIRLDPLSALIFILGTAAIVGLFWEFFEWGMDRWFVANFMGGLNDTLSDLLMDFLGGLAAAVFRLKLRLPKRTF